MAANDADLLYALRDINQEYITNESNKIWLQMQCDSFLNTELPNVDHFALPNHPKVLNAMVAIINAPTPRSLCSSAASLHANSWLALFM